MVFPIAGGNESKGYDVENSLRFNAGDSPYLSFTLGTPTNDKIYTWSYWVKRGNISTSNHATIFGHGTNDGSAPFIHHAFETDNELRFDSYDNETTNVASVKPSMLFRDPSAWYHIIYAFDTTQSTASNRLKIYVNGNQITDLATTTYPAQNKVLAVNKSGVNFVIGEYDTYGSNYLDAYLAEINFVDGQQLSPTDFGEFNDSGVWIPKKYTGTYGNNGVFLEFKQTGTSANSSGIGADTSGNDNHFAVTNLGATDITEDTCTNNFATLNSIDTHTTSPTLAEGNLDFTGVNGTVQTPARSTIAVSSGKWYMEYKYKTADGGVGIMTTQSPINDHLRDDADVRSLWRGSSGGYYYGRNESGAIDAVGDNSETFSADDIGMIALDLDNGNVYFGKNGTWFKGQDGSTTGVPTSGSSGTGSANHPSQLLTNQHDGVWAFMAFDRTESSTGRVICNFGNPPYTPSSGNTDGKYGNFEYAPPSGFYALCTKRLAEFG